MKERHDGDCTFYAAMMNAQLTDGICTCGFAHQHLGNESYDVYLSHLYSDERIKQHDERIERLGCDKCASCGSKTSMLDMVTVNNSSTFQCSECEGSYVKT